MMPLDFVPLWTLILGFGVFMYVLMDGFDLGVGILFRRAPNDAARDIMMNSVAPIWDGNETWLVLGGVALLAAFPLAFAIILPAVYFPILIMLMALIFRGIAFELRFKASPQSKHRWDAAFHYGSLVATLAQGFVLGAFVQGFRVDGRFFAGGSFDWLTPFSVLTAISLVLGYALLGATWLIMKTEGVLQDWARTQARWLMGGLLVCIGVVSLWTPFLEPKIWVRWFYRGRDGHC
jgi:cytochrome d ubiquinol oxidase subunit II